MAYFSEMTLTQGLSTEHKAAAPTLATHSEWPIEPHLTLESSQ